MGDQLQGLALGAGMAGLLETSKTYEQGLRELYGEYGRPLFGYALALTCSVEDAEDAVQEVFLRIAREWPRFLKVRNAKAYLFTAIRNAAYTVLRSHRRRQSLEDALQDRFASGQLSEHELTSLRSVALRQAFTQLPVEQRDVLALRVFHEMTFREVADTIGASINTVAGRYRYGIQKLREALGEQDHG